MTVPQPGAGDQVHPPCGHCNSADTTSHCVNPRCTWVKCRSCHRVSDTRRLKKGRGSS